MRSWWTSLKPVYRTCIVICLVCLIILLSGLGGYLIGRSVLPKGIGGGGEAIVSELFFPTILVDPVRGVQVDISIQTHESLILPGLIYQSPARWQEIEKYRGEYLFTDWLDYNVQTFTGNSVIIGTRTTPEWARVWNKQGSPPMPEFYDDYGRFAAALCARYSPWGIEVYNEPDVPMETTAEADQYWFGAWIERGNVYEAGLRYGALTNVAYPMIKKACPGTRVLVGALIAAPSSLEFLQGAIAGGLKGDVLTYHKYITTTSQFNALFDFADELSLVTDLPLGVTETSLLSYEGGAEHESLKADYVQYLRNFMVDSRVLFIEVYAMNNGWRNSDLAPGWIPNEAYSRWMQ